MDFSNCETNLKKYDGAAPKKGIWLNDSIYMLKFPTKKMVENKLMYTNSVISEHKE